jgi:hypothetical protein
MIEDELKKEVEYLNSIGYIIEKEIPYGVIMKKRIKFPWISQLLFYIPIFWFLIPINYVMMYHIKVKITIEAGEIKKIILRPHICPSK